MAGTFPITHGGLQVGVKRAPVSAVSVNTSESGIESRILWNTSIRWRYSVRIVGRSEVAGELAALQTLVTDNYVESGTMSFTDPYDNVTRTVRFDGPPSFGQYQIPGWWMFEANLISVV
jgi:hypothetical protein